MPPPKYSKTLYEDARKAYEDFHGKAPVRMGNVEGWGSSGSVGLWARDWRRLMTTAFRTSTRGKMLGDDLVDLIFRHLEPIPYERRYDGPPYTPDEWRSGDGVNA